MKKLIFLVFLLTNAIFGQSISLKKSEELVRQGQYDKAETSLLQILERENNHLRAKELLGDIASVKKDWDKATSIYEDILKYDSGNADYNFKYGASLAMKAISVPKIQAVFYVQKIKFHLEKAVQINPRHIEAHWALVKLYTELPGFLGGSEETALEIAKKLLKISKVDGCLALGYIGVKMENFPMAEKNYLMALKIGNSPHTHDQLALFYLNQLKNPVRALEIYEAAFFKFKKMETCKKIAQIIEEYNLDTEKRLRYINLYLQENPQSKEALMLKKSLGN